MDQNKYIKNQLIKIYPFSENLAYIKTPSGEFSIRKNKINELLYNVLSYFDSPITLAEATKLMEKKVEKNIILQILETCIENALIIKYTINYENIINLDCFKQYSSYLYNVNDIEHMQILNEFNMIGLIGPKYLLNVIENSFSILELPWTIKKLETDNIKNIKDMKELIPQFINQKDFIITVADSKAHDYFRIINQACILSNIAWMRGVINELDIEIGPVFYDKSCCYECLYQRYIDNVNNDQFMIEEILNDNITNKSKINPSILVFSSMIIQESIRFIINRNMSLEAVVYVCNNFNFEVKNQNVYKKRNCRFCV